MSAYFKISLFSVLAIFFSFLPLEGRPLHGARTSYKQGYGYRQGYGRNYHYRYNRGWTGNQFRWPPNYAYYGYPRTGLVYQYTYPFDSSYFYSYPSSHRGWTYPSYPYNGTYYVDSTPIHSNKYYASYRSYSYVPYASRVEVDQSSTQGTKGTTTSVFLND